ncbi:MAG: CHAT domain-containing protein [Planctomycetes bacterium]|nr:CHAT domain-containing protein [Planctomycetota bacterium]
MFARPIRPRSALVAAVLAACAASSTAGAGDERTPALAAVRAALEAGRPSDALALAARALAATDACDPERIELLARASEAGRRGSRRNAPETGERARAAVELAADLVGASDPRAIDPLVQLALLHAVRREWKEARARLAQTIELANAASRGRDPRAALAEAFLAYAAASDGRDLAAARAALARSNAIQDELLPRVHVDRAWRMELAAVVASVAGEPERAVELARAALALRRELQRDDHPELVNALLVLGGREDGLGHLAAARAHYEEAFELLRDDPVASRQRADAFAKLARIAFELDDDRGARAASARARAELARLGELDSTQHADLLRLEGELAAKLHDDAAARKAYAEALAVHARAVAPDPCSEAATLGGLCALDALGAAPATAEERARCARFEELAGRCGDAGLELARVSFQAWNCAREGDLEGARRVLASEPRVADDPSLASDAARVAHLAGDDARALELGLRAGELARANWERSALFVEELGRLALRRAAVLEAVIAPAMAAAERLGDPRAAERVLDALLASRGRVQRECAERARLLHIGGDPELARTGAELVRAREALAALHVQHARGRAGDAALDAARADRERCERRFAECAPVVDPGTLDVGRLRGLLGDGAVLVSYARTARPSAAWHPLAWTAGLQVFVLRADGPVTTRYLGTEQELDEAVLAFRSACSLPREAPAFAARARALRRLVWDPVAAACAGATRVHVVPEGTLAFVPFDALLADDGRFLAECAPPFAYHDAEHELARRPRPAGRGMLALGDPAYGAETSWARLEESRGEVEALARMHAASPFANEPVTVLVGADATERALRAGAPGRRIVHLATHGYFDASSAVAPSADARGRPVFACAPVDAIDEPASLEALLRSGLAFARGSDDEPPADDGRLSAEEALALDLQDVEWCVLSACETALGELRRGEAAVGLRRALRTAGARIVIGSVWPVPDRAARAWMEAAYRARFESGADAALAMRTANLSVLAGLRRAEASDAPVNWAGFLAVGELEPSIENPPAFFAPDVSEPTVPVVEEPK